MNKREHYILWFIYLLFVAFVASNSFSGPQVQSTDVAGFFIAGTFPLAVAALLTGLSRVELKRLPGAKVYSDGEKKMGKVFIVLAVLWLPIVYGCIVIFLPNSW
jgi:hypothetical protein